MSAIQELQPYCDAFQSKIREAKERKHYTLQRLIDESGVPKSAVNNINAGKQTYPLLYNAAALCKVLGLSLDELFGLTKPLDSPEEQQKRIHELELENVRKDGEIKRLEALNSVLSAQLSNRKPVIYSLIAICAILVAAVIGYMIFDIRISYAGLFRSTGTSAVAIFLGLVIIAAVGIIVYAARTAHREMKK